MRYRWYRVPAKGTPTVQVLPFDPADAAFIAPQARLRKHEGVVAGSHFKLGGFLLLAAVLLVMQCMMPVGAIGTARAQQAGASRMQRAQSTTSVNATIYLATDYLASMFQSHIAADVPGTFNADIMQMVSRLPKQDQGWALTMAETILQPSATLEGLTPQAGGLDMALRLSLYPGDPKPIDSDTLISFGVLDSSTVQVSAQPVNGSPEIVSPGPLSTFQIPIGQLNTIKSTPGCGSSALALNMQFPVALGSAQGQVQRQYLTANVGDAWNEAHSRAVAGRSEGTSVAASAPNAFIEIPASSLAAMGSSIGSMPVGNGMTAQNIRLGVSGSDLTITSDIYWSGIGLGTAVTTVAPMASHGNIVVHVISTSFTLLWMTFPMNSYNAQIEQTLNAKLGNALAGKFAVSAAGIGPMQGLPCVAGNSLVLVGSANIGG